MIFLNFKLYAETGGENTVKLCRLIQDGRVVPCLQAVDIYRVKQALPDLEVWGQHADPVGLPAQAGYGKFTGFTSPLALAEAGAGGTLLNHCEHPADLTAAAEIKKAGLKLMIITDSLEMIKKANRFRPDFIGFEDPKLIGGPVAMIEANFDLVKQAAEAATAPLIVGGGIRTADQVKKSFQAGGQGVLVASEFAKSADPAATLKELISGLTLSNQ